MTESLLVVIATSRRASQSPLGGVGPSSFLQYLTPATSRLPKEILRAAFALKGSVSQVQDQCEANFAAFRRLLGLCQFWARPENQRQDIQLLLRR